MRWIWIGIACYGVVSLLFTLVWIRCALAHQRHDVVTKYY